MSDLARFTGDRRDQDCKIGTTPAPRGAGRVSRGTTVGTLLVVALLVLWALPSAAWGGPAARVPRTGQETPHAVEGRSDCLLCHGPEGTHPAGEGHETATNVVCLACHRVSADAPAAGSAGDPVAASSPAIRHGLAGRTDCLLCHGDAGPVTPGPDHDGRGNETCQACHAVSLDRSGASSSFARAGRTPHTLDGRGDCLACHGRTAPLPFGASHSGRPLSTCLACHPVDPAAAGRATAAVADDPGAAPDSIDPGCLGCHGNRSLTMTFPSGESLSVYVDAEKFRRSLHGGTLSCGACHADITGYPHPTRKAETRREYALEHYEACRTCHFDNYTRTLDGMHYQVMAAGNDHAPVCTDCHGAHEVQDLRHESQAISLTCARCHGEVYDTFSTSVHGQAVTQGNRDVPGCTDCHEAHGNRDPRTVAAKVESHEICAKCHSDPAVMDKYGISTDVLDTFAQDFHGLTLEYYKDDLPEHQRLEATCVDCHGIHDIKATDDPTSRVAEANLAETCRTCHEDATDRFPTAWLGHYRPSPTHAPIVYWVSKFYYVIVPLTVGGLSFHILLDFIRIVLNRIRRRRTL